MLQQKIFTTGDLQGTIYDFPEVDDILPMHDHDKKTVHITIVARGKFKVRSSTWEKIVETGLVLDWQPHQPHEFIAIEPNSRIVNIIKQATKQI